MSFFHRAARVAGLCLLVLLLAPQTGLTAPLDFRELVKSAGPSVVNINTERTVQRRAPGFPGMDRFPGHPDIDRFFEQFENFGNPAPDRRGTKRSSLGSGFVISADGYIVTNNHVIEGADVIKVTFSDKQNEEGYKAEVIGINTAIAKWAQGIGFAIPSNMAKRIIDDLKSNRKVTRGFLGVGIQSIDQPMADALGMKKAEGVLIGNVVEGQPADKAGIKPGDVIIAINGTAIEDTDQLLRTVALLTPGTKANVTLWREGKESTVEITVAEKGAVVSAENNAAGDNVLGIESRALAEGEGAKFRIGKTPGVLVLDVDPEGLAAAAGLRRGDIIISVNRGPVTTPAELGEKLAAAKKQRAKVLLHVARDGNLYFRALDLGGK